MNCLGSMEEWRDVKGYEGLYQVSNEGRVKSLDKYVDNRWGTKQFVKGKVLTNVKTQGYLYIGLNKNGKYKRYRIHRLVAEAFIPNPNNFLEVNHKDENPDNNTVENLEWCDHSYNINYGTRNKRVGKHFEKNVYQYSIDGELLHVFDSLTDASNFNECSISSISTGCKNVKKGITRCGYFFSFIPLTKDELSKAKAIKEFYIKHKSSKEYVKMLETL